MVKRLLNAVLGYSSKGVIRLYQWICKIFLLVLNKRIRFFFDICNLHFMKQNVSSHQVFIYLSVRGIPVKEPLQNSQIVEEKLDV